MSRILIVNDETASIMLTALRQAYANMRASEESKGGVIVVDTLGTFKEAKQMLNPWPIHRHNYEEYVLDILEFKKDLSRSMFLTDARSKRSSHKGRKKKVNRLRVKRKVKNRHRRNK